MHKYHFYKQHDRSDCGATCLRIICRYYGKHFTAATMQRMTACGHEGTSFFELKQAADALGMETCAFRMGWEELKEVRKPCILHWGGNHFVVLVRIRKRSRPLRLSSNLRYSFHILIRCHSALFLSG